MPKLILCKLCHIPYIHTCMKLINFVHTQSTHLLSRSTVVVGQQQRCSWAAAIINQQLCSVSLSHPDTPRGGQPWMKTALHHSLHSGCFVHNTTAVEGTATRTCVVDRDFMERVRAVVERLLLCNTPSNVEVRPPSAPSQPPLVQGIEPGTRFTHTID